MVTLVWRTDVHMSDQTPVSRVDDWRESVLNSLIQVGEIAREFEADAVIDGGDFFDKPYPSKTSHLTISKVMSIHEDYPCPVYCNVGNHDLLYGKIENLPKQPLEVLFESGTFKRLYNFHEAVFEKEGVKVRVVGVPYHGTRYDLSRLDVKKEDEDFLVVTAHVLASEKGGTLFEGEDVVGYDYLEGLEPDVFMFGHFHHDQGVREISRGKWVVNTGSLTRGSLKEDSIHRKPCCVVIKFDTESLSLERVNLNVSAPEDVFNFELKEKKEAKKMVIDSFLEELDKADLSGEVEMKGSLEDAVRASEALSGEVRERILYYLQKAD